MPKPPLKTFSAKDIKARAAVAPIVSTTSRAEDFAATIVPLNRPEDYVREIGKLWDEAQRRFLSIGRYLRHAIQANRGEFEAKILPQLPFGRAVAYQLREVAEAVETGRFREAELPRSYSAAYYLTLVPEQHLSLARSRGLVRPQAARSEIMRFLAEIKPVDTSTAKRRENLLKRREFLVRQMARIHGEIAEIESELATGDLIVDGQAESID
ncbi:hypothetical protein [Roseomonas mucosa]|uniref:hypothetical protein n=1 Tax=Roseomonas mucosa TaxID=207340 RepID=UPI00123A3A29|nr:hypothetical protein [Roseomonas mucosa]MDT8263764.1 hypothetical protein [Roseomonas sp. DSM 102946]QET91462.1 hypothetical protein FOB66_00555 [Roseomonas mucosa]